MEHFEKLNSINVNNHTEEKNGLTYLSWAWAWAEVKKQYPDAQYKILRFENNLPYIFDEKTGYMVFTQMTIEGTTHEMWLPVMDGANNAMLDRVYTYQVKKYEWNEAKRRKEWRGEYEEKTVEPATMFDINKTIMRCLVKNIAMFGLGLYIYAGEDLPENLKDEVPFEEITEEERNEETEKWHKLEEARELFIPNTKTQLKSLTKAQLQRLTAQLDTMPEQARGASYILQNDKGLR
ncbi:MAG: DUF1071 domain-containing protein [Clostridia bacterium]|nr:DUF1071 domain-containing protein [Clostridia bacterium]